MLDRMLLSAGADDKLFVEDVFSTYLYTGTSAASQPITNGIDLAGKGGLVWVKRRGTVGNNILADTSRGASAWLSSNLTNAQSNDSTKINSFTSSGFVVGSDSTTGSDANNYASWTFREAPNFFDVVTYTGDGASNRAIPHNLGVAPGMIIVKATNSTDNWVVYHRSLPTPTNAGLYLNTTATTQNFPFFPTVPDATNFYVKGGGYFNNDSGITYVAYLYAHDAGGFGDSGNDNVVSCGSYTGNGTTSGPTVTLGWEPQWVLVKRTDSTGNWSILDSLRNLSLDTGVRLFANTSGAESGASVIRLTSTGFTLYNVSADFNASGGTYIYMAIRRGPMRTPTLGTSVFSPIVRTGTGAAATVTSVGFPLDTLMTRSRNNGTGISAFGSMTVWDRLRGVSTANSKYLFTDATQEERGISNAVLTLSMNGYSLGSDGSIGTSNYSSNENYINYCFRRAPGFMDVVCYTATTGSNVRINHNLGVAPELIITKSRSTSQGWYVYAAPLGRNRLPTLNTSNIPGTLSNAWGTSDPTPSDFGVDASSLLANGATYVAYLFASAPGVSKVGSYTGTGESDGSPASAQTINCGFSNGARFVLIKATSDSGDWYVFDTASGITTTASPFLWLNTTNAQNSGTGYFNYVEPHATGFTLAHDEGYINACNFGGRQYIYLAIA